MTASRKCLGLASWVHWLGPGRFHPPFVAITRSAGYGASALAISSSLTSGPYESAVSMKLTPNSTLRRRTRRAESGSLGGPQIPSPVRRMAPKPRRRTVNSPPSEKVPLRPAGERSVSSVCWFIFDLQIQSASKCRGIQPNIARILRADRERPCRETVTISFECGLKIVADRSRIPPAVVGKRVAGRFKERWKFQIACRCATEKNRESGWPFSRNDRHLRSRGSDGPVSLTLGPKIPGASSFSCGTYFQNKGI